MNQAIIVFCFAFLNFVTNADIIRAPRVTEKLYTNILNYRSQFPKHFVDREGVISEIKNSESNKSYFVVYSEKHPDGGRILSASFVNDDFVFEDVMTKEKFRTEFMVHSPGLYDVGYIILDGSLVNVTILLSGNDKFVFLTWGRASNSFTTGDVIDEFLGAFVGDIPTATTIKISYLVGEMYVTIVSPKEFQDLNLQSSTNLKEWSSIPIKPSIIRGYENVYVVPFASSEFYRVIE